jgi:NADPH-dependent curcumin reductase CurA
VKQIVLAAHPQGNPKPSDFRVEEVAMPVLGEGEILLKTLWLSLDPLIRFALDAKPLTGMARVGLSEVLYGGAVSRIVESRHPDYAVGELIECRSGWREYAAIDPATQQMGFRKVPADIDPNSMALGILGMPGQTAYVAAVEMGRVAAGETLVISGAGGAVGTIAGQIAKMKGARVVGIAGGPGKCAAVEAAGFDACVDYKAPDFAERLAAAVPDKVQVYIDNVGGPVTMAVMQLLAFRARMVVCGSIAYYGEGLEGPGPNLMPGFLRLVMSRALEIRGFAGAIMGGQKALDELTAWVSEGKLRNIETVIDGLENAAQAFCDTFAGGNDRLGKLIVRVGA